MFLFPVYNSVTPYCQLYYFKFVPVTLTVRLLLMSSFFSGSTEELTIRWRDLGELEVVNVVVLGVGTLESVYLQDVFKNYFTSK